MLEESWTQFRKVLLLSIRRSWAGQFPWYPIVPHHICAVSVLPHPFWSPAPSSLFFSFPSSLSSADAQASISCTRKIDDLRATALHRWQEQGGDYKYLRSCKGGTMISITLELQIEMYLGEIAPMIKFMPQVRRWWEQLMQRKICSLVNYTKAEVICKGMVPL